MKDNGARAEMERAEDFIKKTGHVQIWRECRIIIWRPEIGELGNSCSEET